MTRKLTNLDLASLLAGVTGAMLLANAALLYRDYFGDAGTALMSDAASVMLIGAALCFIILAMVRMEAKKATKAVL
jgi:hypothetical protein